MGNLEDFGLWSIASPVLGG